MAKNLQFLGNVKTGGKNVDLDIEVVTFEEDNLHYCYAPALDVTGYGLNQTEAKKSFEISLGEFFAYTVNKGTLEKVLTEMGWTVKRTKGSLKCTMPEFSELIESNRQLEHIVDRLPFQKKPYHTSIPMFA